MKLYDKHSNRIAVIVLSNDGLRLKKNNTEIDIISYGSYMFVLPKKYVESFNGDCEDIDDNKIIATIEWGILGSKNEAGLAKVINYGKDTDLDLVLTIATSTFILHKREMDSLKTSSIVSGIILANSINSIYKK